ncbi:MAG: class I SAM-dependent methyltransferase [Deltaproteobacteria bacterium]|nr:class I SAM-dependent methyltransferase [Deltaproteobacteria bacterium]
MSTPPLRSPPVLVSLFLAIDSLVGVIKTGLDSVYQGVWLGLLSSYNLDSLTLERYRRWPRYRSRAHNEVGLFPWEEAFFGQYLKDGTSVLVASSGGGREAWALVDRGLSVDVFDCNPDLVRVCRDLNAERNGVLGVFDAPPGDVPAGWGEGVPKHYDTILIGWGGYTHIPGRANRVRFLGRLRSILSTSGVLALSCFQRTGEVRSMVWTHRIAKFLRKVRGAKDEVQLGDRLQGTFDHFFSEQELREELAEAGLDCLHCRSLPLLVATAGHRRPAPEN